MSTHKKESFSSSKSKSQQDDINSKIADFMADIDEIVLGKKSNTENEPSEWQQCFDETTQAIYYWNTKTNECSWDPPPISDSELNSKKRTQTIVESKSPKKLKKPSLIAEYTSSESDNDDEEEEKEEETVDEIDELLEEVLEKKDEQLQSVDLYPLFEADCRVALARLSDLADRSKDALTLKIQLETRLEDCLAGHLSKSYAVKKLEEALVHIDDFEKLHLTKTKSTKPSLTTSEMALLLSLPPPPPPPSPPPSSNEIDPTVVEKPSHHHHHHHQSKDKKSKPAKTLPTDLIQKWAHARQELRSTIPDIDDS